MAPVWRSLVTRDGPGTTDEGNHMSTGAIIGIACGAGALFLGSAILFVIYWRRQRQYNAEDDYYPGRDEGAQFNTPTANPIYTLDYKGEETVETASYAATPQTSHTGRSGFTPLIEMASAMPTHPAYIPRAIVRPGGSGRGTPSTMSPSSGTTSHFSPLSSRQQPPQQPQQRIESDDVMAQTFINISHDPNERRPATNSEESEADTLVESRNRYDQRHHPSANSAAPIPIPVPVPAHIMQQPTYPPAARRKQYSPPRLNINTQAQQSKYINSTQPAIPRERVPISAVDISGPLAFPPQPPPPPPPVLELGGPRQQQEHHQQYQKELELQFQDDQRYHNNNYYEESPASGTATDGPYRGGPRGRSFRDRSLSSRGGTSRSRSNRGADRSAVGGGGGDWYYASSSSNNGGRQGQQYQHHKETHYEEVEIGRNSDDDIW